MSQVIIASTNPVKIDATKKGFRKMFPDETFKFLGVKIPSGVPDQPFGEKETFIGAKNRALNARKKYPEALFWVGIEGGLLKNGSELQAFAWIFIKGRNQESKAKTGTFFLPQKMVKLIKQGEETGTATDIVFKSKNSKQNSGAVGLLTKNQITRTTYYSHAVVLALIPFCNKNLY